MRRSAPFLLIGVSCLMGCQKPKESVTTYQGSGVDLGAVDSDYYASEPVATEATTQPEPVVSYGLASVPRTQRAAEPVGASGRRHVVAKGDTLFKLARRYYNDPSRWKDIYQANAGRLSDPNMIRVGQELVIP